MWSAFAAARRRLEEQLDEHMALNDEQLLHLMMKWCII